MAGFTEQVKILIDVVTGNAKGQLGQLKAKVDEAEGGFGKLKAAGGGAFDLLKANGPAAIAVVGTAVAGFAAKSIQKFQETAIAAGKFSDATGLGVENASRWQEVAGDVGIGADTIATAFGKMEKSLGTNKQAFADLAVAGKDGATDINATFLNVIEHLQGIKDPIERATEASKFFGKGFQGMAELTATSADELRKRLAAVSDQKVITEGELEKARKFRESMDTLHDSVEDVQIELGQALAPAVGAVAEGLSKAIPIAESFTEKLIGIEREAEKLAGGDKTTGIPAIDFAVGLFKKGLEGDNPFDTVASSAEKAGGGVSSWGDSMETATGQAQGLGEATGPTQATIDALGAAADLAARQVAILGTSYGTAVDDINAALDGLDTEDQAARTASALENMKAKALIAWDANQKGAADATQKQKDYDQSVRDVQRSLLTQLGTLGTYKGAVAGLPDSKITSIKADIDNGSFDRAAERIEILARNRTMTLSIIAKGGAGVFTRTGAAQHGGSHSGPTLVGEQGPELVDLPAGSNVHTAAETKRMMANGVASGGRSGGSVVINMNGSFLGDKASIGRYMQEAIAEAQRRGFRVA